MLVMGFAAGASAQQFRWTDKDGRVQYGDTPPPGVKATRLRPPPPGTAPAAAAKKDAEKPLSPEAAFRKRQQEQAEAEKKSAQASSESATRRENCEAAQAQVRQIQSGQRISTVNAQGERVFLEDAQVARELARAQQAAAANCQ
ncbi:MAG TPA: DUF4124 domain-containing protein [Burkholderiales bacterium]|nr:DUF4124 domain-containing protein [Burkholderiales bacterium]